MNARNIEPCPVGLATRRAHRDPRPGPSCPWPAFRPIPARAHVARTAPPLTFRPARGSAPLLQTRTRTLAAA